MWIKTEDRLPDKSQHVIAYAPNGKDQVSDLVIQAYYHLGSWTFGYHNNSLNGVTHWMPLPQPPEE